MLDLDNHFHKDGIAMLWSKLRIEQVGEDGNNSALELWGEVCFAHVSMDGCSLVYFVGSSA